MAESELSVDYTSLLLEVSAFLGYGSDLSALDVYHMKEVERYVKSGIRQFYYPPAIQGATPHCWSFLNPVAEITTRPNEYSEELPDDFARVVGDITYQPEEYCSSIVVVSEFRIYELRERNIEPTRPKFAAVRNSLSDEMATRKEIIFWPTPDAEYTLNYVYEAFSGDLTEEHPYPLGGMKYSELIIESCLSVAEQRGNDEAGLHTERFNALLLAGIAQDKKSGAHVFGSMGGPCESPARSRRVTGTNYPITYNGNTW